MPAATLTGIVLPGITLPTLVAALIGVVAIGGN
jgi:hypothetical protein